MPEVTEQIAKIIETFLGWEDHGIFTAFLRFDYGHSVQGGGQYMLSHTVRGSFDGKNYKYCGAPKGIEHLMGILQACGVDQWEKLKGRTVFVVIEDGLIRGIKPLPTESGKAFMFKDVPLWEGHEEH